MSVYNVSGETAAPIYDYAGEMTPSAFNKDGERVYFGLWYDEISVQKLRDDGLQTNYYLVRIPQTRQNGQKQFPFVFCPNGASGGTQSTLEMMRTYGFFFGMNAGYFDAFQTGSNKPYGITIENGELIREAPEPYFSANYTLTIDGSGLLGYADPIADGTTAQELLDAGAVSAVLGLVPLVVDYEPSTTPSSIWGSTERAQRQIIGQYANGDYAIVTCEGRDFDDSAGFLITEARTLCTNLGLRFAIALDGGGSTETVIGDEQVNAIYEGAAGRIVPTYIVFNGTDQFFVPNS